MFRKLCFTVFIAIAGAVGLCSQGSIDAQGKKDDPPKQVQQLQKAIKERDQTILKLEAQIQKLKLGDVKGDGQVAQLQQRVKQLEAELKKKKTGPADKTAAKYKNELDAAHQAIKERDQLIATLQAKAPTATAELSKEVVELRKTVRELEAAKKAPFAHASILKLKKADDAHVKTIYAEANKSLAKIAGVRSILVGKPAENGSPTAQTAYQLGVVILLDDAEALQKFLDDPLHKQFNDKMADLWERPIVYDFQRDLEAMK